MTTIKIISATPGQTTTEQILELIKSQTTGMTIKEISSQINRPVSMLQIYLKQMVSSKQIYARKSQPSDQITQVKYDQIRLKTIYTIRKNS